MADVEIVQDGRGGTITYRESSDAISFGWEFAMPPAIALLFGPAAAHWDRAHPWAAGRQAAIYDFVGAEVVRQQASGGRFVVDLEQGMIEVLRSSARRFAPRPAVPVVAVDEQSDTEAIVEVTVDGPSVDDSSVDDSLAPTTPLLVARQIRALHQPSNGLARTLRLAEQHDGPVVRQALLWASYNRTDCSSACAALLLRLTGADIALEQAARESLLGGLGPHNSYFTRQAAFEALCKLVAMELDAQS